MSDKGFDLGDYVEVKDRIRILYEFFPQARIETTYELTREPDDKPKVIARALVYRQPEDERPAGHGTSWLNLPGSTPYTKGSEIENAETSAVGRAIGMLGILIDRSIATTNEIEAKRDHAPQPRDGSLIGVAKTTAKLTSDGELRETVGGHRLGFRLQAREGDKGAMLVEANDPLASTLAALREDWVDQPVTVWGVIEPRSFTPNGSKKAVSYEALVLSRIQTPTFTLPANDAGSQEAIPEPPKADAAPGGQDEPPAGALSPEDEAELDLALT